MPHGGAERGAQLLGLLGVDLLGDLLGVLPRGVDQLLGGLEAAADVVDAERQFEYGRPAGPGALVGGQAAGPADVPLGGAGGPVGGLRLDAVPPDEDVGDRVDRRRTQGEQAAARADGGEDVLHGGGAEQPDRTGRGLLDGLEEDVAAPSVRRSASSRTITCQRPPDGESEDRRTRSRVSLTPMDSRSVRTISTSAWVPIRAVWQPSQKPQPGAPPRARSGLTHCNAAAKARAAVERPEPGGPVNSQACVIWEAPPGSADGGADGSRSAGSCPDCADCSMRPGPPRPLRRDEGIRIARGRGQLRRHPVLADHVVPYRHRCPPFLFRSSGPCRTGCLCVRPRTSRSAPRPTHCGATH